MSLDGYIAGSNRIGITERIMLVGGRAQVDVTQLLSGAEERVQNCRS